MEGEIAKELSGASVEKRQASESVSDTPKYNVTATEPRGSGWGDGKKALRWQ